MTNAAPQPAVGRFVLDKNTSRFTVRAFASGMLSAMGHNPTIAIRDFSGEAVFAPETMSAASLRVQIRADSLEVTDDIKSKDRQEMESMMNQKVLESAKYPAIIYESTGITANQIGEGRYQVILNGSLTLHGVTRNAPVTAQVALTGAMLRAYGEFSILQSNYGISPVTVAAGALKLKDELKFTFDIVARKQD